MLGVVNHSCSLLQSKRYVSGLIRGRAGEGSCAKGLDNVTKLLQQFRQETFVLGQCVHDGCILMGHEMVHPGGAFPQMAQLPCELLSLACNECATILMPDSVDDFANVGDIGSWNGHCESVCVQD